MIVHGAIRLTAAVVMLMVMIDLLRILVRGRLRWPGMGETDMWQGKRQQYTGRKVSGKGRRTEQGDTDRTASARARKGNGHGNS
ncbi:hypothetical protein ACOJCM_03700 [Billgrantia sp. LNSP4103-1]